MKQIISSVFFDILSYTMTISSYVFLNLIIIAAWLAEVSFLSCLLMVFAYETMFQASTKQLEAHFNFITKSKYTVYKKIERFNRVS